MQLADLLRERLNKTNRLGEGVWADTAADLY